MHLLPKERILARGMGFRRVASGPLVRSSYHARDMAEDVAASPVT